VAHRHDVLVADEDQDFAELEHVRLEVTRRLQDDEELVVVVDLDLWPLVALQGVLDRELVQFEFATHGVELLLGRLVQPDPHERPRRPARLERLAERDVVLTLAVAIDGQIDDRHVYREFSRSRRAYSTAWSALVTSPA
jgi:hypothetical protein